MSSSLIQDVAPDSGHLDVARPDDTVGTHLRRWRLRQRLSQMELALQCDVSTRHLSFVETGRARPSRDLVLHLARRLRPSNHELSVCLLAAGFAPSHLGVDDTPINGMLEAVLTKHDPAPAFVFDADWVMRRINEGGQWLCSVVLPGVWATIDDPRHGVDMLTALADPGGLLSQMRDAGCVGRTLVRQLRLEQLTNPALEHRVNAVERSVRERFPASDAHFVREPGEPALELIFDTVHGPLSFVTVQGVFGIPQHITVGSLRSELWFPLDAHTQATIHEHVRRTAGA